MDYFTNRIDAGRQLAERLKSYQNQELIVYALPRGGVVVAKEIAEVLHAPLDLIFAHKIGHPMHAEYAVGAVTEDGQVLGDEALRVYGKEKLEREVKREIEEMKRRRDLYLKKRQALTAAGKIAIIVDDGVATGKTMEAGILALRRMEPAKIVVAVPVSPEETFNHLASLADDAVSVITPSEGAFMGAVGAYYLEFDQVEDDEVIRLLA